MKKMKLSGKQKKYIKKRKRKMTMEQMAKSLGIEEAVVGEYLGERQGKRAEKEERGLVEKIKDLDIKELVKTSRKVFLLLFVLVAVAYANSVPNGFVSDDIRGIVKNENIENLSPVFSSPISVLRFLQPTLHFFVASTVGKVAGAFRAINLFFHLGVVWLVFILVSLIHNKRVGILAACLVAVHPIMTESVVWISGGGHVMYSFFLLLSFLFYVLSLKDRKLFWLSVILFVLAVGVSEKAGLFPVILLVFVFCFRLGKKEYKRLAIIFVPAVLMGLFFLSLISGRLEILREEHYHSGGMANMFSQIPVAISSYLGLMVWPDKLTLYHSEMDFAPGEFLVYLGGFLAYLAVLVWTYFKNRKIMFWMFLFLISLAVTLTPWGVSWVVAERYVYFGTIGIMVIVALLFEKLLRKESLKVAGMVIFGLIVAALTIRTIVRNKDWKSEDSLWLAAARTSPSSHQNHNNLGDYYGRQGDFQKAEEEFKKAIELKPNYADAYHNLGNTYRQMGRQEEAMGNYEKALEFNSGLWQSYHQIAALHFEAGEFEKSGEYLKKALEINPEEEALKSGLALIYMQQGRLEEAEKILEGILESNPENERAKELLEGIRSVE